MRRHLALNKILEQGVNTKTVFQIEICEDGSYLAVRNGSPMFCLSASSIEEAAREGKEALDSYKKLKDEGRI